MSQVTAPKTILVFCDGTGQDGLVACDIMGDSDSTTRSATNVLRLSRAVRPFKKSRFVILVESTPEPLAVLHTISDGVIPQIVFYQTGVGTDSGFDKRELASATVIQAFGRVVASKIRDAYTFIAQNYEEGDEICLFGYSRGAYTVRKVAGLIDRIGLLSRRELGQFTTIWSELNEGKYNRSPPSRPIKVKCVGVWDTVGSVRTIQGQVIDALSIKDCSLPGCIEYALHALAFHENRAVFPPTLWNTGPKSGQILKQVWFGGCHADVGGGQLSRELADLSLFWMAGEIDSFISLDSEILWASHRHPSAAWGASQPYNSFEGELATRALGAATRSGEFSRGIVTQLHESLKNSPFPLRNPRNMLTLNNIPADQRPQFAPLNSRDQELKGRWLASPASGKIVFEKPTVLSDVFVDFAKNVAGTGLELVGRVVRGFISLITG